MRGRTGRAEGLQSGGAEGVAGGEGHMGEGRGRRGRRGWGRLWGRWGDWGGGAEGVRGRGERGVGEDMRGTSPRVPVNLNQWYPASLRHKVNDIWVGHGTVSSSSTSALPQEFEIGESSRKISLERHEEQIEEILNHLDELSLDHIEHIEDKKEWSRKMEGDHTTNFDNLVAELREYSILKISKTPKKAIGKYNSRLLWLALGLLI
ncbi:hypothetical protein Tco_0830408 [Tanacetum coccineum]